MFSGQNTCSIAPGIFQGGYYFLFSLNCRVNLSWACFEKSLARSGSSLEPPVHIFGYVPITAKHLKEVK